MINDESVAEKLTPTPPTSAPQGAGPQIELSSDEDWKNRVKAEDAALDQRFRHPADAKSEPSSANTEAAQATDSASTDAPPAPEP